MKFCKHNFSQVGIPATLELENLENLENEFYVFQLSKKSQGIEKSAYIGYNQGKIEILSCFRPK